MKNAEPSSEVILAIVLLFRPMLGLSPCLDKTQFRSYLLHSAVSGFSLKAEAAANLHSQRSSVTLRFMT